MKEGSGNPNNTGTGTTTSHEPSLSTSDAQVGGGPAVGTTSSTSNNMTNKDGGATASTTSSSSNSNNIDNISNQAVLEFLRKHGLHQAEQELQTFMNSSSKRNENENDNQGTNNNDSKRTGPTSTTGTSGGAASIPLWNPSKVEQDEKNRQTDGTGGGGSSSATAASKPAPTIKSGSQGGPTPMDVDGGAAAQQKVMQQQQSLLNRSTGGGMMGYDLDHASTLPTWASTNTAAGSGHPQQVIRGLRKYGCQEAKQLIDSFVELQTWFTSLPGDIINNHMMGQPQPPQQSSAATNNANTMIKSELLPVCFALLANSYCELLEGGMDSDAKALLDRYGPWYNKYFSNEVRELQRLGSSSSSSSGGSGGSGSTNKTSASASFISWNANVMKQRELMEDNRQMQYQMELLKQDIEKRQQLSSSQDSSKPNSVDTSPATIKTLQEDLRLLSQRLELSQRKEVELRQNHVEPYRFMVRLRGSGSGSHRLPLRMTTRAYSMLMTFLNSTPHVLPMSVLLMAKCIIEVQPDTSVSGPTSFKPSPSSGSSSYYPPSSSHQQQQQQPPPPQFSSFGGGPGQGRHPSQPYGVGGGGSAPPPGGTNTTTMMGPGTSHPSWTSGGAGSTSGMNNMPGPGMQQQQPPQPQQPFHPDGGSYPSAGNSSNAPPSSYHPPNQTNIMTTGGGGPSTVRTDTTATNTTGTLNESKINNSEPLRLLEVPSHHTNTINNVMDDVSSRQRMNSLRNQLISYTNQEFNQALLINGFRRLEALETEKRLRDERLSKLAHSLKEEKKDTDDKTKDGNDDDPLSSIMEQSSSKRLKSATSATAIRSSSSSSNSINIDEQTILMATFADATSPSVIDYAGVGDSTTSSSSVPLLQEAGMEITCARFSPDDGRRIAIGCDDSVVRVWFLDQSSSELVAKQQKPIYDSSINNNALSESHVMLIGHKCSWPVFGLDWGPDGRHLISCGGDGSIRLWDTSAVGTKGTLVKAIKKKSGSTPTMSLSGGGGGGGDMSNVGGLASTTTTGTSTMEAAMATNPIVPGQRGLDYLDKDSSTRTAVEIGGAALAVYYGHCDGTAVWNCRFAPCGYYFASCGSDSTTNIWVTERISPVRCLVSGTTTISGGGGGVNCLAWHPNVNYLLTGSGNLQDRTCRLYDIQTGKCVRILSGFDGWLSSVEISPDGRTAATVDSTGIVATYDLASGRRMCEFGSPMPPGHNSICFNSSGTVLASGAGDGCVVKLWDVARAHRMVSYHSHHPSDDSGGEEEKKSNDDTTTAPLPVFSSAGGNNRRHPGTGTVMTVPSTKTFTTKDTLTLDVRFTKRNLLLCAGKYSPVGGMF